MNKMRWNNQDKTGNNWNWRLSFWRLELQLSVYRHTYPNNPNYLEQGYQTGDRWVFKPHLVYDRKHIRKSAPTPAQEVGE